jgi:hypothetical protein
MNQLLPPGPWEAKGNTIKLSTGRTIAVVFYPAYAAEIARVMATIPDLLAQIEELKAKLESKRLGYEDEFDGLEDIE